MTSVSPSSAPDDLERLFRRLVDNVAELDATRLDGPLLLAEIHQNLVPYRTHRAVLGIETNQDYEMTVLRLAAGERGYARTEPDEVRHQLEREVRAVNPDTGVFRRFPNASVRLDPDQVRVILSGRPARAGDAASPSAPTSPPRADAAESVAPAVSAFQLAESEPLPTAPEGTEEPEIPFSLDDGSEEPPPPAGRDVSIGGAQCGYCGGDLPVGRTVIFCPHCGQNVGVMHCPVCGTELDVGWRYCITCGREMAGLG
ncbi:MAG: zinc ribbon domain-containing protein [Gemmatimonadales bacterium]